MKRIGRKAKIVMLLLVLIIGLLVAGSIALWNIQITEFTVIGNHIYTDEEIISYIFPEEKQHHTMYAMWRNHFGEYDIIPFIKSYEVQITGSHSAEIVLYEKGIVGALRYMGTYLYFDSDGYVVDASTEELDGVVAIDGIQFDYFVLNDKLPVKDDSIFNSIMVLSRSVTEEKLDVSRIYLDVDLNITIYIGNIRAYLGEGKELEKKIHALADVYPAIKKKKGTLYLNYSATILDSKEYFFKEDKDPDAEESETETEVETLEGETEAETTTEAPTEGIPVMEIDPDTGEVTIYWTQAETTTEEPTTEETTTEAPLPETPAVEEPVPETPAIEEPVPETPSMEEPLPENPVPENPMPENPLPEAPIPEVPMQELPVGEPIVP